MSPMCATPVETRRYNGSNRHADKLDEEIAKRLHGQGKLGIEFAEHYGSNDSQQDLKTNIIP
jgi:hypothetical protein